MADVSTKQDDLGFEIRSLVGCSFRDNALAQQAKDNVDATLQDPAKLAIIVGSCTSGGLELDTELLPVPKERS